MSPDITPGAPPTGLADNYPPNATDTATSPTQSSAMAEPVNQGLLPEWRAQRNPTRNSRQSWMRLANRSARYASLNTRNGKIPGNAVSATRTAMRAAAW
jgi:hypothetical protein